MKKMQYQSLNIKAKKKRDFSINIPFKFFDVLIFFIGFLIDIVFIMYNNSILNRTKITRNNIKVRTK